MLHIKNLRDGVEVFKALGSDVRMRIVELLLERGQMNMNELATALELTNGALTSHIRRLEECGIIQTVTEGTGHGNQKLCSMKTDQILLTAGKTEELREIKVYETEVRIGHYSDYKVTPPCGMCSVYHQIGTENDVRYFSHPDRLQAGLLWLSDGFLEYRIPNMIPTGHHISQVTFYFEISQDHAYNTEESLTDVAFYLNGHRIGAWLTPDDFRWGKGIYTPLWWSGREKQVGVQKMIVVNFYGTYLDGLKISDVGLNKISFEGQSEMRFRIAVENEGIHRGGMVLYGSGFGNFNQDISVRIHYISEGAIA